MDPANGSSLFTDHVSDEADEGVLCMTGGYDDDGFVFHLSEFCSCTFSLSELKGG